jgi:hypothetical protein
MFMKSFLGKLLTLEAIISTLPLYLLDLLLELLLQGISAFSEFCFAFSMVLLLRAPTDVVATSLTDPLQVVALAPWGWGGSCVMISSCS